MKKILIDAIHLGKNMKGVGLYVFNVLKRFIDMDTDTHYIALVIKGTPVECLPGNERIEYIQVPWQNHFLHGFRTLRVYEQRIKPDVIWIPYETPVAFLRRPYLMLCHDVPQRIRDAQILADETAVSLKERFVGLIDDLLIERSLRKAVIVFSNSAYVANWLRDGVGVDRALIRYAPCAPASDYLTMSKKVDAEYVRRKLALPQGYVLVFFTGDQRENFTVVPKFFQRLVDAGQRPGLVIAGVKEDLRLHLESVLSAFSWYDRVRIIPFIETERVQELADIYTAASCYVETSLHEGFGMQVIEAMSCGTPVVSSNRGALPEVAGTAAILVNPEDADEIAEAVMKVIGDDIFSSEMVKLGYEQSGKFTWDLSARTIIETFSCVAGNECSK